MQPDHKWWKQLGCCRAGREGRKSGRDKCCHSSLTANANSDGEARAAHLGVRRAATPIQGEISDVLIDDFLNKARESAELSCKAAALLKRPNVDAH